MFKLSHQVEEEFIEHSHARLIQRERMSEGSERLVVGVPSGNCTAFSKLIACLAEQFFLLYVLHTSRGEGKQGRYQSPEISKAEVNSFLKTYSGLLSQDARQDIWIRSQSSNGTLVWDRHNVIYAYGPISEYESALFDIGYSKADVVVPVPHCHHYREEFDSDAKSVLSAFEWKYTPLRPEDKQ